MEWMMLEWYGPSKAPVLQKKHVLHTNAQTERLTAVENKTEHETHAVWLQLVIVS